MNVTVHIERLVLDGLPVTRQQGPLVQAAVESELARLLESGGLTGELAQGGAVPSVRAAAPGLSPDGGPDTIGTQIAQAIYGGINQ